MTGLILLAIRALLVILLYAFLSWTFLTLWRELKQQISFSTRLQIPNLLLTFVDEPYREGLEFTRPQITLGRNPVCDCVIADETVSSEHARFIHHHNQWWVEDLNSTNGTYLNNQRITTLTVLTSGDQLRLGQVDVLVNIEAGIDGR
jgi:pSer/pThr/pTyr-binding forkhead associated (FHA) protein